MCYASKILKLFFESVFHYNKEIFYTSHIIFFSQVHTNVFVKFGMTPSYRFLRPSYFSRNMLAFIAPFHVDTDFRSLNGCVAWQSYEHLSTTDKSTKHGEFYRAKVQEIIRQKYDSQFKLVWSFVATWFRAVPYSWYRSRYNYYSDEVSTA